MLVLSIQISPVPTAVSNLVASSLLNNIVETTMNNIYSWSNNAAHACMMTMLLKQQPMQYNNLWDYYVCIAERIIDKNYFGH